MSKSLTQMKFKIPLKYEPREEQLDALSHSKKAIKDNKKFILGNMPTGTGKSYFMAMLAHYLDYHYEGSVKFTTLTESKMLQQQYVDDFDFVYNLSGRSNYTCKRYNTNCETGSEMAKLNKTKCVECPYKDAKEQYMQAKIGLTNYHMFITQHLYQQELLDNMKLDADHNVLIVDECHSFEDVFCGFVSLKINVYSMKSAGFNEREISSYQRRLASFKDRDSFITWLRDDYYVDLMAKEEMAMEIAKRTSGKKQLDSYQRASKIAGIISKIDYFDSKYEEDPDNWLFETDVSHKGDVEAQLRPIWGRNLINDSIWSHYDLVVLMSGTIINPSTFCYMNGIDPNQAYYFEQPSPFPIGNRPIHVFPVGKMNFRNKREVFENQWEMLKKIAKKHKDDKGVFHTQTYEIKDWILEKAGSNAKRLLYHDSSNEKDLMINEHKSSKKATIIVSPSVKTGLDLKNHLSRFQVILKVPYPNLGDKRIKMRMEQLPQWYADQTILELVQMYGRSVRNKEDWAHTYILDSNFTRLFTENPQSLPRYFQEAVKFYNI